VPGAGGSGRLLRGFARGGIQASRSRLRAAWLPCRLSIHSINGGHAGGMCYLLAIRPGGVAQPDLAKLDPIVRSTNLILGCSPTERRDPRFTA
jgi:hypothetical protein